FNHTQPGSSPLNVLSQQESRVLTFMADGMTNREIASRMSLSEKTVKNYSSHMMGKLGVTRRTEAAALFWKHNKTQQA
ncbi:MAG: response regulator transcription factor, partial [Puniceicoccales bacterium]